MALIDSLSLGTFTDFIEGFANWNIILIIIVGCSILAFTIFIERLIQLRKAESDIDRLLILLRKSIHDGNIVDAISHCEASPGALSNVIRSGLAKHGRSKEEIESAMEVVGMLEIARLEKNAKALSIIAHITPLIGLLGTVLGFIRAFSEMRQAGLMDISATRIGEAMEYALVTTAAGLVVAIPTVVAYNYIAGRIQNFVLEMQTTSPEIVEMLSTPVESYELQH